MTHAVNLPKEEARLFASHFSLKTYSKNEKFVRYGEVCDKVGFVKKGLLKCAFVADQREAIDDFVFLNNFTSNYQSFLSQTASAKNITCVEDTEMLVITPARAKMIYRATEDSSGRLRYLAGSDLNLFLRIRKLLPDYLFFRIARNQTS